MNGSDITTEGNQVTLAMLTTSDGITFRTAASCVWPSGSQSVSKIDGVTPQPPGFGLTAPPGSVGYQVQVTPATSVSIGAGMAIADASGNPLPVAVKV
jgi:hypothetical protein